MHAFPREDRTRDKRSTERITSPLWRVEPPYPGSRLCAPLSTISSYTYARNVCTRRIIRSWAHCCGSARRPPLLAKLRLSLFFSLPISLHLPVPILFSSLFSFLLSTLFLYPPSLRPLLIGSHQGSSTRVNVQRFLDRNPVTSADLTLLDSR